MFIDFARVRPAMGDVPGEELILNAEFSVHTAKENSMFNVASICSYGNTVDVSKKFTKKALFKFKKKKVF